MKRDRFFLGLAGALWLSVSGIHAQSVELEVKRIGPRPDPNASTRKVGLQFRLQNTSDQPQRNLLVFWTLVVDESEKPGPKKYIDQIKIVSLRPRGESSFHSRLVTVSAKGGKPALVGYAVRVQSGNKILLSRIEPSHLAKELAAWEEEKASTKKRD